MQAFRRYGRDVRLMRLDCWHHWRKLATMDHDDSFEFRLRAGRIHDGGRPGGRRTCSFVEQVMARAAKANGTRLTAARLRHWRDDWMWMADGAATAPGHVRFLWRRSAIYRLLSF
jgi:hypothetical protein